MRKVIFTISSILCAMILALGLSSCKAHDTEPTPQPGPGNQSGNGEAQAIINGGFVDSEGAADVNKSPAVTETYHNYGTEQGEKIDFCFYKGNETVLEYEIITKNYAGEGETEKGYVSDHYGVIATFKKFKAS